VIVGCDCKTDGDTGKGQREVRTLPVRTRCSQTGAANSAEKNNARLSSVLMKITDPVTWLHIQETWLRDDLREAGSYDF